MSKGIGSGCVKLRENDEILEYSYYCYDLNVPEHRNEERVADGVITIRKTAGEDLTEKLMAELLKNGTITVKNSSNCWAEQNGVDYMVFPLCLRILKGYHEDGHFPERCSYCV